MKIYAQRDIESDRLSGHYMRHLDHMTTENLFGKSEIAAELAWRDAQIADLRVSVDALSKFKAYVHQRLDEAGIPADPDSPHKAEGCRIGGRLDIALAKRKDAADFSVNTVMPK